MTLKDWKEFVFQRYKNDIETPCIEVHATAILLNRSFNDEPFAICHEVYDRYFDQRYSRQQIKLPHKLELVMQCELANMALTEGDMDKFRLYASMARDDSVGHPEAQTALQRVIDVPAKIEHEVLLPFRPPVLTDPPPNGAAESGK